MGTEMPYCQGQHRLQLRSEQLAVCATNKAPSFQRVNTGNKVYVGPRCSGAHLPLPLLVQFSHVGAGRPRRLRRAQKFVSTHVVVAHQLLRRLASIAGGGSRPRMTVRRGRHSRAHSPILGSYPTASGG